MRVFVLFFTLIFLFSCEEQFGLEENKISQDIIKSSLTMFEGEIIEQVGAKIDGIEVWKVKIENESGALVTFYWQKGYSNLFRIEGERGPFDYEIEPPINIIVLSTARFLAFGSTSNSKLRSWKLIRLEPDQEWVYQFYLEEMVSPISVDAQSGDPL